MTMYEDDTGTESVLETDHSNWSVYGDVPHTHNHYTNTKNTNGRTGFTENGRCVSADTYAHSVPDLMRLDSTSLFSVPDGNTNGDQVNNDMETLCSQLGSFEMTDMSQKTECFNEFITYDRIRHNGQMQTNFDSTTIYTKDNDGDTFLHTAIILREIPLIMLFISKARSYTWLAFKNLLFQTPLHLAALTNQPEVIRRLIVAGAEVDARDKDGNTALHIACRDGCRKSVNYILEPVRYHETKQNAYEIPYQQIPQDLAVSNYEGLTCLHLAAMNEHLDIVEALLDKNIDVNLKEGKTGRTILHNACLNGDINLVKLLLRQRSCNINARAFDNSTPFDLARDRGHDLVCMALAAAGARYGVEDSDSE